MRKSILYFTVHLIFILILASYRTDATVDENDNRFNTVQINDEAGVGDFGTTGIMA